VVSYPLLGQFGHFFLQFVQDVKVWLVLSGVLLELNHTLVRILLEVNRRPAWLNRVLPHQIKDDLSNLLFSVKGELRGF